MEEFFDEAEIIKFIRTPFVLIFLIRENEKGVKPKLILARNDIEARLTLKKHGIEEARICFCWQPAKHFFNSPFWQELRNVFEGKENNLKKIKNIVLEADNIALRN